MRRSFLLFREIIRRCGCRHVALLVLLFFSCLTVLIAPRGISSHEPVTTKVMFNREIVRIFQRHCLACHNSESATNISLATYAQARPWAKAFKEEVLERRMPPYQAVKGFGHFHDDYTLTQYEIDQLVSWVEGGAPKGDDKDLPAEPTAVGSWILGQPDLLLKSEREASISSGEGDEYRCFALPTNLKQARWVTAVDFRPTDASEGAAVHCASFWVDMSPVRRVSDDSVDCGSIERTGENGLGIWLPGQNASRLPRGVARLLPAGAHVVLRIHYHKASEAVSAGSSLGLYFARGPAMKRLRTVTIAAPEQDIPAGAERHRVTASYTMREAAEGISIRPLLFPFATSVEVTAHRPDGTIEVLIWARDYRYDWQPEYYFQKPVPLPQSTRIDVTAYLDNSDSNPNRPNIPASAVRFKSDLCELSFINGQRKTTSLPVR